MIGMSGDPPFVEHEQQACPLLFDNETDHYTQFVNRCFGNPAITELEEADAADTKGCGR
jgi:hypothetical protein